MSCLAALVLTAASARIDLVSLTTFDSRPALRIAVSGSPGRVALQREGDTARLAIGRARLGPAFPVARRFAWSPIRGLAAPPALEVPAFFRRLVIAASEDGVDLELRVPAEIGVELQRDVRALVLVSRPSVSTGTRPGPAVAAPPPSRQQPPEATDTTELARRLFPSSPGGSPADAAGENVADLYRRLFPHGTHEPPAPSVEKPGVESAPGGAVLGPFRVRASVGSRFVDGDTFLQSATPTRDRFLEVEPRVSAEAALGTGRFAAEYRPVLRALARYDRVNSSSHLASVGVDLPVRENLRVRAKDRLVAGTLDTRFVDPGGEYFYGLGRFYRDDLEAGASLTVAPRLSAELAAAAGILRFRESSTFFDHDTRSASAGLRFELTSTLDATLSYVYDTIPRPSQRPEAEARAQSLQLSFEGQPAPLLSADLVLGYRSQDTPNAGEGGRHYSGLTLSGVLTRRLGPDSLLSIYASRSTPASAFEANGFYVATSVQGSAQVPLPLGVQLRGGLGYQWNRYRTVATEIGRPRHDAVLGWFLGLRRELRRHVFLSGTYRVEDRRSNIGRLQVDGSGFVLQLEWDAVGSARE